MQILNNPSQEDLFDLWANELLQAGYISEVKTPDDMSPMNLFDGLYRKTTIDSKTVVKKILSPVTYKPDRVIVWNNISEDIFFRDLDKLAENHVGCYFIAQELDGVFYTALDIKSPFNGRNLSDAGFIVKQKMVWEKYEVLVQKCVLYPSKKLKNLNRFLWAQTFTPSRYFMTDKLTKARTIKNWTPVKLDEFLSYKKALNK